jgi:hypothetical protein
LYYINKAKERVGLFVERYFVYNTRMKITIVDIELALNVDYLSSNIILIADDLRLGCDVAAELRQNGVNNFYDVITSSDVCKFFIKKRGLSVYAPSIHWIDSCDIESADCCVIGDVDQQEIERICDLETFALLPLRNDAAQHFSNIQFFFRPWPMIYQYAKYKFGQIDAMIKQENKFALQMNEISVVKL